MNTNEVLKLALEALEWNMDYLPSYGHGTTMAINAITALREALAQPQQEPDAIGCKCLECGEWQRSTPSGMTCKNGHGGVQGINYRLYTSPPARKPLTDEEIGNILPDDDTPMSLGEAFVKFARAIEAAHGIKGDA